MEIHGRSLEKVVMGDLLKQDDVDAIVNTVNCVGVMGKGIALQFKNKWPKNFKLYEAACKAHEVQPGKMFVFDAGAYMRPHFIINFPTKDHWRGKSKIEFIQDGLVDLVAQIKRLDIRSIAIPPLGCGNGGLDWDDVRPLIVAALAELPKVDARVFEPSGAPDPKTMEVNTSKPRMTLARAAIVKALDAYAHVGYGLSKLEVQKLVYFMQLVGVSFPRIVFVKERYGPYSETLRHALESMEGHYIHGLGDGVVEAEIEPTMTAQLEATSFLEQDLEGQSIIDAVARVADLIDGFQSAYGMELLSTVHWVATNPPFATNPDEVLAAEDPAMGSPEGDRLELLAKLVEDYEKQRFAFARPDPLRAILFRMEERGCVRKTWHRFSVDGFISMSTITLQN